MSNYVVQTLIYRVIRKDLRFFQLIKNIKETCKINEIWRFYSKYSLVFKKIFRFFDQKASNWSILLKTNRICILLFTKIFKIKQETLIIVIIALIIVNCILHKLHNLGFVVNFAQKNDHF
jgi:hypothetical protein